MVADSSKARPVRAPIETREASTGVYNRLVYDKGAAVLLMLENWLGPDTFRKGIQSYLAMRRFGTAGTDDLAQALQAASGKNPATAMHSFLDESGPPEVSGVVECEKGDATPASAKLRITRTGQQTVPVCWRTGNGESGCEEVDGPKIVKLSSCPVWTYWNAGGAGYYRTAWTAASLAALRVPDLTPAERLTLAYDLRAQKTNPGVRSVLELLSKDSEPEIVEAAREALK